MMKKVYRRLKNRYLVGERLLRDQYYIAGNKMSQLEREKRPFKHEIINYLLQSLDKPETTYLEIGVKDLTKNYDEISSTKKFCVDPGVELIENFADFKITSDEFFKQLRAGEILHDIKFFDVIFIDGLHLADQVDRDIKNALDVLDDNGYIVLHDCNPPTEWHAREEYGYKMSPATKCWNGTTWKAFYKYRLKHKLGTACIDTDWGVGIITKKKMFGYLEDNINPYYEYRLFNENRQKALNLMSFDELKKIVIR